MNIDDKKINITLSTRVDKSIIKRLVTQVGELEIYETFNRRKFISSFVDSRYILWRFNGQAKDNNIIGCASKRKVKKINKFINTWGLDKDYKFAWQVNTSKDCSLYALNDVNILDVTEIEDVYIKSSSVVSIRLKNELVTKQKETIRQIAHKPVAILLDNQVFCTSYIKTSNSGRNFNLINNFDNCDMRYFEAIVNNGKLPHNLSIAW